jgi:hypothetical protein
MIKMVSIINREQVVEFLQHKRCKTMAAQLVEDISYSIGFKGERFPDYILTQTLKQLLATELVREIECEVVQNLVPTEDIYYIGVLPHDVESNA